jgi:hypothetical protein
MAYLRVLDGATEVATHRRDWDHGRRIEADHLLASFSSDAAPA